MVTESRLVVSLGVEQQQARLEQILDERGFGGQGNEDLNMEEMRIIRSLRNNNTIDKLKMWSSEGPRVTTTVAGEVKPGPRRTTKTHTKEKEGNTRGRNRKTGQHGKMQKSWPVP